MSSFEDAGAYLDLHERSDKHHRDMLRRVVEEHQDAVDRSILAASAMSTIKDSELAVRVALAAAAEPMGN